MMQHLALPPLFLIVEFLTADSICSLLQIKESQRLRKIIAEAISCDLNKNRFLPSSVSSSSSSLSILSLLLLIMSHNKSSDDDTNNNDEHQQHHNLDDAWFTFCLHHFETFFESPPQTAKQYEDSARTRMDLLGFSLKTAEPKWGMSHAQLSINLLMRYIDDHREGRDNRSKSKESDQTSPLTPSFYSISNGRRKWKLYWDTKLVFSNNNDMMDDYNHRGDDKRFGALLGRGVCEEVTPLISSSSVEVHANDNKNNSNSDKHALRKGMTEEKEEKKEKSAVHDEQKREPTYEKSNKNNNLSNDEDDDEEEQSLSSMYPSSSSSSSSSSHDDDSSLNSDDNDDDEERRKASSNGLRYEKSKQGNSSTSNNHDHPHCLQQRRRPFVSVTTFVETPSGIGQLVCFAIFSSSSSSSTSKKHNNNNNNDSSSNNTHHNNHNKLEDFWWTFHCSGGEEEVWTSRSTPVAPDMEKDFFIASPQPEFLGSYHLVKLKKKQRDDDEEDYDRSREEEEDDDNNDDNNDFVSDGDTLAADQLESVQMILRKDRDPSCIESAKELIRFYSCINNNNSSISNSNSSSSSSSSEQQSLIDFAHQNYFQPAIEEIERSIVDTGRTMVKVKEVFRFLQSPKGTYTLGTNTFTVNVITSPTNHVHFAENSFQTFMKRNWNRGMKEFFKSGLFPIGYLEALVSSF